ncbi:MAG: helix-turn-helix domain-containing protein [Chloroflexi bacterium]|nr:helix-turn-helix domain-containing protein [Chloroflexota bacterium]
MERERPDDTYTVLEIACKYGVNPETVRRWVREAKIPARKYGNMWFINANDVEALIGEKQERKNG